MRLVANCEYDSTIKLSKTLKEAILILMAIAHNSAILIEQVPILLEKAKTMVPKWSFNTLPYMSFATRATTTSQLSLYKHVSGASQKMKRLGLRTWQGVGRVKLD